MARKKPPKNGSARRRRILALMHESLVPPETATVEQVAAADGSKHPAYRLTKKGRALIPVLEAMRDWGLAWEKGTKAMRQV